MYNWISKAFLYMHFPGIEVFDLEIVFISCIKYMDVNNFALNSWIINLHEKLLSKIEERQKTLFP